MLYEIAGAKGSLPVMCFLESHQAATRYELTRGLKLSKEAIDHAILVLERLGLCVNEHSDRFPFPRKIRLTPQGERFLSTPVRELPTFFWRSSK